MLGFRELYHCPIQICVSTKSAMLAKKAVAQEDLSEASLVIYGVEEELLKHLQMKYDENKITLRTSNLYMCRAMVALDQYAVGFTNAIVERYMKNPMLTAIPLKRETDMILGYFISDPASCNEKIYEFINMLKNEVNNN